MPDCCHKVPILCKDGKTRFVPCGKCENCLSNKQNDFLVRAYRAGLFYGNLHLLTLTYNEESLPISGCIASFSDGEVESHSYPFLVDSDIRSIFFGSPRKTYFTAKGQKREYIPSKWYPFEKANGRDLRIYLCPCVNKDDVRAWLRKCRTYYERKFGLPLPEFKYSICPEYGGISHRPHYHVLVYGLTSRIVHWMLGFWRNKFGFVDYKHVKLVNPDGSDGFAKATAYVSKYISKGMFDAKDIADGYTFKCRVTSSKYLGLEDAAFIRDLRTHHLAFDMIKGEYSLNNPFYKPYEETDVLSGEFCEVRKLVGSPLAYLDTIVRRMKININGFYYALPRSFKNVLFRWYDPTKKRFTATELSRQIESFLQARAAADLLKSCRSLGIDPSRPSDFEAFSKLAWRQATGADNDVTLARSKLLRFYKRAKLR